MSVVASATTTTTTTTTTITSVAATKATIATGGWGIGTAVGGWGERAPRPEPHNFSRRLVDATHQKSVLFF